MTRAAPKNRRKRFWVWVTGPAYYLDGNGLEAPYLDPASDAAERPDEWWTCHRDTSAGDLILLYRSRPRSDLAYLFETRSNAKIWREYPPGTLTASEYGKRVAAFFNDPKHARFRDRYAAIDAAAAKLGMRGPDLDDLFDSDESGVPSKYRSVWRDHHQLQREVNRALGLDPEPQLAGEWEGSWVCNYSPRFKFSAPISRAELRSDRYLTKEWPALRANFRQRVYEIPESVWAYLIDLIARRNAGFQSTVSGLMVLDASADIVSEKHLEDALQQDLRKLSPDFDLELFRSEDGTSGRQYPCVGAGGAMGFIDLLCTDRGTKGFLVIELKVVRGGLAAFAQLRSYIGWIKEHIAMGKPVRGLLISDGVDEKFRYALGDSDDISTLDLSDVRARLAGSIASQGRV